VDFIMWTALKAETGKYSVNTGIDNKDALGKLQMRTI